MNIVRVALCQLNPVLGDLDGNIEKMKRAIREVQSKSARIVLFPELIISGYPPQDNLKYDELNRQMEEAERGFIEFLKAESSGMVVIWGNIRRAAGLRNSAKIYLPSVGLRYQDKRQLPNYGVFDEDRYFRRGNDEPSKLFVSDNLRFGVTVCEDIWYQQNHLPDFALNGAQLVLNINASPYHEGKHEFREGMLRARAGDNQVFIAYCNMVGGQDGIVFDGDSIVVGPSGNLIARAKLFEEDILYADLDLNEVARVRLNDTRLNNLERPSVENINFDICLNKTACLRNQRIECAEYGADQIYRALVLMTRDYVRKNGFSRVVIGASGGIDSALVAAIAVDALGPENVHLILMPSRYSSKASVEDAFKLARNLGVTYEIVPVSRIINTLNHEISSTSMGDIIGTVAEENIQARARAIVLMAYVNSNPDTLLLTTGNKSEISVGYFTLYGDSAGAFNPLLDVYKTKVYELARRRNMRMAYDVIPRAILDKPPSAELRDGQKDIDSLPPYGALDKVLELHIEHLMTSEEIISGGFSELPPDEIRRVVAMIQKSEHKRQQAVLGSKISPIAFGIGRRMPNVNKFKL